MAAGGDIRRIRVTSEAQSNKWLPIGGGYGVPERFRAFVTCDGMAATLGRVVLSFVVHDAKAVIEEVRFQAARRGGGVARLRSSDLRIPLDTFERAAVLVHALELDEHGELEWVLGPTQGAKNKITAAEFVIEGTQIVAVGVVAVDGSSAPAAWEGLAELLAGQRPRPPKATPVADERLRRVAEVYRTAIAEGRHPKQAVRGALYVAESTASRYIKLARERGYLGKSKGQGAKGEVTEGDEGAS